MRVCYINDEHYEIWAWGGGNGGRQRLATAQNKTHKACSLQLRLEITVQESKLNGAWH